MTDHEHRSRRRVTALFTALFLSGSVGLAGCDFLGSSASQAPTARPAPLSCPAGASKALTLVVGARANSPQPELPSQVQTLVYNAALAQQPINVVLLDGAPAAALSEQFSAGNQKAELVNRNLNAFVNRTINFIGTLRPKTPQADVLAALSLAAQITPAGGTVVLLDSGIPTTGPISYQDPDMFGADPGEVAAFLSGKGLLPDLSGKALVLVNVGQSAAPQPLLEQNVRTQVVKLWEAVAQKAGAACSYDLQTATSGASVANALPVAVVQPPPPPAWSNCGTTTLGDNGAVGFIVGESQFRNPTAANSTLQSLAQVLLNHTQQVTLIGATSSEGDPQANITLSQSRAEAVKNVLVGMGVDASRITTEGKGSDGPGHITDIVNGVLIPAAAEHNRSVTVTLTCRS